MISKPPSSSLKVMPLTRIGAATPGREEQGKKHADCEQCRPEQGKHRSIIDSAARLGKGPDWFPITARRGAPAPRPAWPWTPSPRPGVRAAPRSPPAAPWRRRLVAELASRSWRSRTGLLDAPSAAAPARVPTSMTSASGSMTVASSTTIWTAPLGCAPVRCRWHLQPRQALGSARRWVARRGCVAGVGVAHLQGQLRRRRHIHLRAHGADRGDQPDHPVHLGRRRCRRS